MILILATVVGLAIYFVVYKPAKEKKDAMNDETTEATDTTDITND